MLHILLKGLNIKGQDKCQWEKVETKQGEMQNTILLLIRLCNTNPAKTRGLALVMCAWHIIFQKQNAFGMVTLVVTRLRRAGQ